MLFLKQRLFDYLKLMEKSVVMVLDNMVDKWCFSIMSFIRSKHINRLPTYFHSKSLFHVHFSICSCNQGLIGEEIDVCS